MTKGDVKRTDKKDTPEAVAKAFGWDYRPANRKEARRYEALGAKLLAIGGDRVVMQPEPRLDALLVDGQLFDGCLPRLVPGRRNRCHFNAAVRYLESRGEVRLASGYALADQGYWSQHSWLWDGTRVHETTSPARAYFGVVLYDAEALELVHEVIDWEMPGVEELYGRRYCQGPPSPAPSGGPDRAGAGLKRCA